MDFDDDEPPMLVESGDQPAESAQLTAEIEDMSITKVPITIITGMYRHVYLSLHGTPSLWYTYMIR